MRGTVNTFIQRFESSWRLILTRFPLTTKAEPSGSIQASRLSRVFTFTSRQAD